MSKAQMPFHLLPHWAKFHGRKLLSLLCAASRTKRIRALAGHWQKKVSGNSSVLLTMEQSSETLCMPTFLVLVKVKLFSAWNNKDKIFLPASLKMAVSNINDLSIDGFNPVEGD